LLAGASDVHRQLSPPTLQFLITLGSPGYLSMKSQELSVCGRFIPPINCGNLLS